MRPSIDRPVLEEPWAKRLRATRSRSVKAGQEQYHLPSPKPTNPSSTDNIPSSSSSIDRKSNSKEKRTQSLRDRLVPLPKKPTPLPSIKGVAATKPPSKPSVAPFFQRIEAAFQDKPAAASKPKPMIPTAREPVRSPSPDADDLIQQLREHYLQTATTLHKQATMRLSQTHADLSRKLTHTLTQADAAFLAETETQIKKLAQPLDRFRIRSQQRGSDGAVRSEDNSVAELVARAEEQIQAFEEEVTGLWREWTVAEGEVKALLRGVVPFSSSTSSAAATAGGLGKGVGGGAGADIEGNGEEEDEGKEMVKRFREAVEREIAEAEEEVVELGDEAVGVMKEIEKDFRKATLPDLHTFFQSIDEP